MTAAMSPVQGQGDMEILQGLHRVTESLMSQAGQIHILSHIPALVGHAFLGMVEKFTENFVRLSVPVQTL